MDEIKISDLEYVSYSVFTPNDLYVVVNYDTPSGETKNTKLLDLVTYLNNSISPGVNTYVTGFTYLNNIFTIFDNSGNTFNATINSVTGWTVNGDLDVTGNTTSNGLTANTISASTYQNLPVDPDTYVTGFTYSDNTLLIKQNNGQPDLSQTINSVTGWTVNGSLNVTGKTITNNLQITSGATNGYGLISDSLGNGSWKQINGRLGIVDVNGVYTYYADLTTALTAAVAGQTIEFFSDITVNTATTYTLKDGVNINGNGHTLTNTNNTTAFNVFTDGGGNVSCNVQNLKVVRSGSVNQGNTFDLTGTGNFDFSGSQVIRLSGSDTGICVKISNTVMVINLYATSDRGQVYACLSTTASFIGCYFRQVLGSTSCGSSQGTILNCYIQANITTALSMSSGAYTSNCNIISGTGQAVNISGGEIVNSSCISTTNYGVNMTGGEVINCHIKSTSQNALYMQGGTTTQCRIFTSSAGSVNGNANVVRLYQSDVYCQWNDVNGHGIQRGLDVHQNRIRVSNLTAKCLFSSAASNVSYSQNNFAGPVTYANPVSATITQLIVNTEDGQGNLLI